MGDLGKARETGMDMITSAGKLVHGADEMMYCGKHTTSLPIFGVLITKHKAPNSHKILIYTGI